MNTPAPVIVNAVLEELWLDLPRLSRMTGVTEDWLHERVSLGVLEARVAQAPGEWLFEAAEVRRVRRIAHLERDFDAVPELAALVADLEDELAQLRARLQRVGVPRA